MSWAHWPGRPLLSHLSSRSVHAAADAVVPSVRRAAPAVDLHDPDLFFVEIVPRHNWAWNISRRTSDTGFLELRRKAAAN